MSITSATTSTCQPKMTDTEKAKALVRLRRRLENYLVEFQYHECAEKRLIQGLVELLYCIRPRDRSTETIIDCVDKLTRGPLLRERGVGRGGDFCRGGIQCNGRRARRSAPDVFPKPQNW